MKAFFRTTIFLLASVPCWAASPKINLVVPESPVAYGDMIIIQVQVDKSSIPPDLAEYKHQWMVLDNGVRKPVMVWPDGTQAFFAAGMQPKQYIVLLDTDLLFVKKEGDVIKSAWIEQSPPLVAIITVGSGPAPIPPGPGPGPGPTPIPPAPTPDPGLPEGQFGLAKFTYQALIQDTTLTPADKVKVAAALSPSFGKIAAQIAALANFRDIEKDILPTLSASNLAALTASGVSIPSTIPFKKVLNEKVYSLYHDKPQKLITADDFATAFREIAAGLAAVK